MAFKREERVLHHQKQNKAIEQVGLPRDIDGYDGEQRYCRIGNQLFLCVKSGGRWYNTSNGLHATVPGGTLSGSSIYNSAGGAGSSGGANNFLSFSPDYDSGWGSDLGTNDYVNLTHGLNCLIPYCQVMIRDGDSNIHLVSNYFDQDAQNGIGVWFVSANQIQIYSGDTSHLEYKNSSLNSGSATAINVVNYRVFLWNTGITS